MPHRSSHSTVVHLCVRLFVCCMRQSVNWKQWRKWNDGLIFRFHSLQTHTVPPSASRCIVSAVRQAIVYHTLTLFRQSDYLATIHTLAHLYRRRVRQQNFNDIPVNLVITVNLMMAKCWRKIGPSNLFLLYRFIAAMQKKINEILLGEMFSLKLFS